MTGKSTPQLAVGMSDDVMGGAPVSSAGAHRSDDGPPTQPLDLTELFRRAAEGRGDH